MEQFVAGEKKNEKYVAKNVVPSVSRSQGIMVWCGINGHGRLCLRRCPKIVRATDYQRVLGSAMSFITSRCHVLFTYLRNYVTFSTGLAELSSSKTVPACILHAAPLHG